MDFFERQDQARRSTKWLVLYFTAGVAALIATVYLVVALIFHGVQPRHHRHYYVEEEPRVQTSGLWDPELFLGVAVGTLAVIGLGAAFKTLELARGGSAVASMLGGRPVSPATTDPDERKLLNVVEEMALASGVPVPQVYVLPEERGINAFAAGHSTSDAVVAVTEGSLRLLSRDELQGVIGHEFSHVLNGDMRLNLRLMGIIFGIVCLAVIGRILLYTRSSSSDRRDRNALPLLGLALVVIGWAGVFFGRLIQAAVSRQREMLADASAVQFTRNPMGLASALKKIGGLSYGSKLQAPHAQEASHMFFSSGLGESFLSLLETHPPLVERIRALDPSFDGNFPQVSLAEAGVPIPQSAHRSPPPFIPVPRQPSPVAGLASVPPIMARSVVASTGTPTPAHLTYAADLRDCIPSSLQVAARDPLGASTLVYALLLSEDEAARHKQLQDLAGTTSAAVVQETLRVYPEVRAVATRAKLPLVDLALPGLRQLSRGQFENFRAAVQRLIESDEEVDLFEYVLQRVVLRHLAPHFYQARKPVVQFYTTRPLLPDCAVLLSALAHLGQSEPNRIQFAFEQGAQELDYAAQGGLNLVPEERCELAAVDNALNRLTQALPQIKKNVLNACAQTVAADGVIQELEAELLRAIADALDCPMPPFIAQTLQAAPLAE
jgi:Zn-dependent protease with chaperone function